MGQSLLSVCGSNQTDIVARSADKVNANVAHGFP
jgi:hypothetical protein